MRFITRPARRRREEEEKKEGERRRKKKGTREEAGVAGGSERMFSRAACKRGYGKSPVVPLNNLTFLSTST